MSNEMKDWLRDQNEILCQKYPFLIPHNRWTGKIIENYDYSYTELDDMPSGWRFTFGEQMCEDIKKALEKDGLLDEYKILQIKEKYGQLRWYSNGNKEVDRIISKYEYLSQFICIKCGDLDAQMYDDGWMSPYCSTCFKKKRERMQEYYNKPIEVENIDKFIVGDKFNPILTIIRFSHGAETTEHIDCSNEWDRIKKRMIER